MKQEEMGPQPANAPKITFWIYAQDTCTRNASK